MRYSIRNIKIPNTFTIVFFLVIIAAILTWIIPSGEFKREIISIDGNNQEIVIPNSYHSVDKQIQTWQVFSAFLMDLSKLRILSFLF